MKYPETISTKLPKVETSIFTVMSALAHQEKALNLSQGFPDFEVDPQLISLVHENMLAGHNQYAPMAGAMALREQMATITEERFSLSYNPDNEITITAGATQAIYSAITSLVKEGDEVIIFTPAYDCYQPAIELSGGKVIFMQLKPPYYGVDWEEFKRLITRRTRMIIINTPHNPTGTVMSAEDMHKLEQITRDKDIIVLSDEVYEHIVFDGYEHQSVARFPKLAERSIIIGSFGKTFHTTGWKMGYVLAPSNITKEIRKVHQYTVFAANHPVQLALAEYLKTPEHYTGVSAMYEEKRNYFNKALEGSNFIVRPSAGTYFQLLDYSKISEEKDTDFSIRLTKEYKIASIPISVFYHAPDQNNVLRFCFAKSLETLDKAAEILHKI